MAWCVVLLFLRVFEHLRWFLIFVWFLFAALRLHGNCGQFRAVSFVLHSFFLEVAGNFQCHLELPVANEFGGWSMLRKMPIDGVRLAIEPFWFKMYSLKFVRRFAVGFACAIPLPSWGRSVSLKPRRSRAST